MLQYETQQVGYQQHDDSDTHARSRSSAVLSSHEGGGTKAKWILVRQVKTFRSTKL